MFDRPWVRLVLGALAAALLGAMAARVAVSAVAGGDEAAVAGARGAGSDGTGGGAAGSGGGSGSGGLSGSGSAGSGGAEDGATAGSGGPSATLGGGSGRVTVHVTGEVRRPGVYALQEGDRVDDAVRRAGGATAGGDRQALNLAAALRDGQQVRVPPRAGAAGAARGGGGGAGSGGAGGSGAGGAGPGAAGPIDLNTASLEELQTLDGVGEATAAKIVKLREERGGLSGVDDLDEVPGIGAKKLEALRAQLEP